MMAAKWVLIPVITFLSLPVYGHVGDRVIPIFEIPAEEIANIDLHDGSIDDWLTVVGEPTLTASDFTPRESYQSYDPADFDFRVWLAWHRTSSRIYVAAQGADDLFLAEFGDGAIALEIDGDHSGGVYGAPDISDMEENRTLWQENQQFSGILFDQEFGPAFMWSPLIISENCCWFSEAPFADAGGTVYGENPTVSIIEMYLTPFDRLFLESPEETKTSTFLPGKVMGVRVRINDHDDAARFSNSDTDAQFHYPFREGPEGDGPDKFGDVILVGVDRSRVEDSVVQADSWGRIKASFGN